MVAGWGYFLIQGVRDPLGGVNSLWPLFGVANQMLAAIALCLATTILLKMNLGAQTAKRPDGTPTPSNRKPALALITLLPLAWLLAVTFTAGTEKIFNKDPRIGFLAQARVLESQAPELRQAHEKAVRTGDSVSIEAASKALKTNRSLRFNNLLDAAVAGTFLAFVSVIVVLSVIEWIRLLRGTRPVVLHEGPVHWLPEYAVAESRPWRLGTLSALALALVREVSGQNHVDRAQLQAAAAHCPSCHQEASGVTGPSCLSRAEAGKVYARTLEEKFTKPNRCC
jgi:carbon starvation protein